MSLRDQLIDEFYQYTDAAHGLADTVLAMVAEALASEAAVRAGAIAITSDPNFGENTWPDDARNVITAALQAAGIVKG